MADCQLSDFFFERLQFTLLPPIPPQARLPLNRMDGGREPVRAVVWIGVDRGLTDDASVKSLITRVRECLVLKGTNYESE